MMAPGQDYERHIRHLEARCNTLEARLARYQRRKTWPRRLWRWLGAQAKDYKIKIRFRRTETLETDPGYFPRKEDR